jgi:transcriptional regulator with XRE-family HTH domain
MNPISQIRKEKGLSIYQLAFLAGVGGSRISQIEKGDPVRLPARILGAAERLGYSPEEVQQEYIKWRESKIKEILDWCK